MGEPTPIVRQVYMMERSLTMSMLCVVVLIKVVSSEEVDGGHLLGRIQTTVHEANTARGARNRYQQFPRPRVSVLDRARSRQQQLIGFRSQNRSPSLKPPQNIPFSNNNRLLGGECQAFKTEAATAGCAARVAAAGEKDGSRAGGSSEGSTATQ